MLSVINISGVSKFSKVLVCLICLILVGLAVSFMGYRRLSKEPDALLSALPGGQDLRLNHIHHVATRDGFTEWVLDADSAQYQKAEHKTVIKDVSATFFLKDGRTVRLVGRDGVLFTDSRDIEVSGDVVVTSDQYELKTDKLHYDHKTRAISTDTWISVRGEVVRLTGQGMIFSFDTEQILVKGGVEAVIENRML